MPPSTFQQLLSNEATPSIVEPEAESSDVQVSEEPHGKYSGWTCWDDFGGLITNLVSMLVCRSSIHH